MEHMDSSRQVFVPCCKLFNLYIYKIQMHMFDTAYTLNISDAENTTFEKKVKILYLVIVKHYLLSSMEQVCE